MLKFGFKFIPQHDQMDCGPACLSMVAKHYGKNYSLNFLRENSFLSRDGVSILGISEAANKIGFETTPVKIEFSQLISKKTPPSILYWNKNHFIVLIKITKNVFTKKLTFHIADPGHGKVKLNEEDFKKSWVTNEGNGIILFLHPTEEFYSISEPKSDSFNLLFLFNFLKPYKKELFFLLFGLFSSSFISLCFPFLTQSLVDKGINSGSQNIVFIILLAQIFLFVGSITIEIIRNWIMLYIGTRININIISEFLMKILRLPIKFFDSKMIGDFNQRIHDHERIEYFLTSQTVLTFFSFINFLVFFFVLLSYNVKIVITYSLLTAFAIIWSIIFLKSRKIHDYYRFQRRSENQESIYELINGIQEIKLNKFEDYKRNEWEKIQIKLFNVNLKILRINQFQLLGFDFINQLKNILVTYIAAKEVINHNITLGTMLGISYIIGQMNSPLNQLISFFRSFQDAKLSLERLSEVQVHPDEDNESQVPLFSESTDSLATTKKGISIVNYSFQYEGPKSKFVLKNLNLFIPDGKTTAIVGASGSGKTTLMKILLKFYTSTNGYIEYNSIKLDSISPISLRENCGVVMQDGYIFSDTIERNIATADTKVDQEKLNYAMRIANIEEFVHSLPLKEKTKIGASGNGISGGQRQRILIARAVYKNPHYILFDEATSALDAENERKIHDNLQTFFVNKTVIIIAHRLSTVKNADQIIVLKDGEIAEIGNHNQLVQNKAEYYNLVKNQLELGN